MKNKINKEKEKKEDNIFEKHYKEACDFVMNAVCINKQFIEFQDDFSKIMERHEKEVEEYKQRKNEKQARLR